MGELERRLLERVADPIPPYRAEVIARSQARLARYLERHTTREETER